MNYHLMGPSDMDLLKKQYALADIQKIFMLPDDNSSKTGEPAISNDEIAQLLVINKRTVENHLTQALADIRKMLKHFYLF